MIKLGYQYWTEWSEEDGEWVGLCDGFPLVSWLEPDRQAAEDGIRAVVAGAVEHLRAQGKRVDGLRQQHSRVLQSGEDCALAVSSGEGPPSVDGTLDDADSAVGRESQDCNPEQPVHRQRFYSYYSRLVAWWVVSLPGICGP